MKVSTSEAHVLSVTASLFQPHPSARTVRLLTRQNWLAPKLGTSAHAHLMDVLTKGALSTLVRGGGWRRERRPVDDPEELVDGRWWERHDVAPLAFSSWTVEIIRWLTHQPLVRPETPPPAPPKGSRLLGDHVVAFAVARLLVQHGLTEATHSVATWPLAALFLAGRVKTPPVDWNTPFSALLLEALIDPLTDTWVEIENAKRLMEDPEQLTLVSERQHVLLNDLLDWTEATTRTDLTDFIVRAATRLMPTADTPDWAPEHLRSTAALGARTEAVRRSAAFQQAVLRIAHQRAHDRNQRFFDEGYEAAQQRLERWETFGDERNRALASAVETRLR